MRGESEVGHQHHHLFLAPADDFNPRQPPGETVALAIVFVPLWVITLAAALRVMRREGR